MDIFLRRYLAWALLLLHVVLRSLFDTPNLLLDLVLYNAITVCILGSLLSTRGIVFLPARISLSIALGLWGLGSLLSTYGEFFAYPQIAPNFANFFYVLFYPFAIYGVIKSLSPTRKLTSLEMLDASIIAIGLSAIGVAFLLEPVLPHFSGDMVGAVFAVIFPVADLAWLALVLALILMDSISLRNSIALIGILVFALSDFFYLSLTVRNQYSLGELGDDGWLLGLLLISESFWHHNPARKRIESLHPVFIALSVMISALLLAITSLRPDFLPDFIVFPTVATLLLAFIRMTIALRQARAIGEERLLARTDELTGLPNRRRFIAELSALAQDPKREGALLLLDLDGFKPINDEFGHEVGDQLLRQVALRFSRALPQGALLARLGGDEFGALILGSYETTLEVALALKATLSYPFSISDREIRVGVSVGHVGNDGGPDLLKRADNAMYQAKREKLGVWSEPSRR